MINFLDQLERDLVEAIDRRERAPMPRRPLRPRVEIVAATVAVAITIAIVVVLGHDERSPSSSGSLRTCSPR